METFGFGVEMRVSKHVKRVEVCFSHPLREFGNFPDIIVGSNGEGGEDVNGHI